MHFDDRLATVLQMPSTGQAIQRIQYRQLLDLLSQPAHLLGSGELVDHAIARFEELAELIPVSDRAAMLSVSTARIANPELIARLVTAEPGIAIAAISVARLTQEEWLDLIPSLPVRARGILRHRRDLGPAVEEVLDRLGIGDRGLPPATPTATSLPAERPSRPELVVLTGGAAARPVPREEPAAGIGAIVQRIEAFRKARSGTDEIDQLPLQGPGAARAHILAVDFTTDPQGRIDWADGVLAPGLVGMGLAGIDPALHAAIRLVQPLRDVRITLPGAPDLSGPWRLDALPRFGRAGGRFLGYAGRMRRRAVDPAEPDANSAADSMRQILHELRTPANAIQIAAEIIQQQLYGPAPHEYRALAAAIAGDTAQILAGFEELDRLVKLETGSLRPAPGASDVAHIVRETIARLHAWTNPRGSGFVVADVPATLPVGLDGDDAARLVWRLLAALASVAAPGETLALELDHGPGVAVLRVDLPGALAERLDAPHSAGPVLNNGQSLSSGMFGPGFTMRLAAAEAAAAGGSLTRTDTCLELQLPGLTPDAASHTHG